MMPKPCWGCYCCRWPSLRRDGDGEWVPLATCCVGGRGGGGEGGEGGDGEVSAVRQEWGLRTRVAWLACRGIEQRHLEEKDTSGSKRQARRELACEYG